MAVAAALRETGKPDLAFFHSEALSESGVYVVFLLRLQLFVHALAVGVHPTQSTTDRAVIDLEQLNAKAQDHLGQQV